MNGRSLPTMAELIVAPAMNSLLVLEECDQSLAQLRFGGEHASIPLTYLPHAPYPASSPPKLELIVHAFQTAFSIPQYVRTDHPTSNDHYKSIASY